jgi:hypothetical protein
MMFHKNVKKMFKYTQRVILLPVGLQSPGSVTTAESDDDDDKSMSAFIYNFFRPILESEEVNMVTQGLLGGFGSIGYVLLLLFLFIYIYAVAGMIFFYQNDPWNFATIEFAMLNLLKVVSLDVSTILLVFNLVSSKSLITFENKISLTLGLGR